ncbi:hypothetical protein DX873_07475, partial [Flagellimonas nanhaiensis]
KKIGPNRPNLTSVQTQPYQLSGCKYNQVIFSPQIVLNYFFALKLNKVAKCCFSDATCKIILVFFMKRNSRPNQIG